jgi:membrane-associated phospholipid phosphatase
MSVPGRAGPEPARDASDRTPETSRLPADPTSAGPLPARRGAPASRASLTVFAGFVALAACLVVLGVIAEDLRAQEVFTLDTLATPFMHSLASPPLDALMNAATFLGSTYSIPPLFVLAVIALVRARRPGAALFLTVASGGSLLLNELMKLFFQRPRPVLAWAHVLPDYSFPSGHTMNSLSFYVALAIIAWSLRGRRIGSIALLAAGGLTLLVGISRIYLGYHYFTDVAGGVLAGTSWLLIVLAAFRSRPLERFWQRRGRSDDGPQTGAEVPCP